MKKKGIKRQLVGTVISNRITSYNVCYTKLLRHPCRSPMKSMFEQLHVPVMPVIVIDDAEDAIPLAEAFLKGGLNVLEITFRTAAAAAAIQKIRSAS